MPDRAVGERCWRVLPLLPGLLLAGSLHAQEPWQEAAAPEPPPLKRDRLVPIELPRSSLRFGVQPDSVSIGPDAVVRYVVVATSSSGAVNAMYEGIRCEGGQVKVYARHNPETGWTAAKGDWQPIHDNGAQRHSLAIARNGACIGRGTNTSAERVLRDLAAPVDERFQNERR